MPAQHTSQAESPNGELHPELRADCEAVRGLLRDGNASHARARHAAGQLVLKARRGVGVYGRAAVRQIERELGIDHKTLYDYAATVEAWPEAKFERFIRRLNARGIPLTWKHFTVLADVSNEHRRHQLVERALRESLSANALALIIHGPGPRPVNGSPVRAAISRLTLQAQGVVESVDRWDALVARLQEQPSVHRRSVRDARKAYEALRAACDHVLKRLKTVGE